MSSPKQPPLPNIRPPNSGPPASSPSFVQQLPPPPITSSSGSTRPPSSLASTTTSRPLPPPPGMGGDMPQYHHPHHPPPPLPSSHHSSSSPSMSSPMTSGPSYAIVPQQQSMPSLPSPSTFPGSTRSNSNSNNNSSSSSTATSKPSLPPIPSRGGAPSLPPPPSSSSFSESGIPAHSIPLPSRAQAASPPGPPSLLTQQQQQQQPQPPPPPTTTTAATSSRQSQQQQQQQQQTSTANNNTSTGSNNSSSNNTSNSNANAGYRPLNVRDALTYLDQVKVQFSAHPDVYNQFLDIMKDFKSQAIDTPGVIERVSILFNGHPDLISGFNTFLPPGYRIECSSDPNEPDIIKVTTPSGITHKRTSRPVMTGPGAAGGPPGPPNAAGPPGGGLPPPPPPPPPPSSSQRGGREDMIHGSNMAGVPPQPPPPSAAGSYYTTPYGHMPHHPPPPPPPPTSSSLPPPQSLPPPMSHPMHPPSHGSYIPAPSSSRRPPPPPPPHEQQEHSHMNGSGGTRRAPVEFNHAINYVNKIKNRYAGDPETYKQFLEILQTYQKERKPIQEVYQHVQYLFNGAPDLLIEFKQFLPEITGQPAPDFLDELEPAYMGSKRLYGTPPQTSGYLPPGKKAKRTGQPKRTKGQKMGMEEDMIAGYPASSYFDPARPTISPEEVDLFEQIRKHIGNKPSYEEFLKTLNLYTQQIIDADVLMKQVEGFLGNDRDLFDWFKTVVAVDLKDQVIDRPAAIIPKPDLNHCKATENSPSYRLVPKEWQNQPCSGRDQLCWEVLNDEYVSHPIWASEDSGFVASKKNQYEEAMHRCEEERYDYDLNIDANLNTIALLEPIAKKLEMMTPEEKAAFRLGPGLGGQSVTIYERIVKKVYEEDRGKEVIDLLYKHPARVVPVLLKRLSQKDEEWRKAQHEWNKAWREMDAKNFYRALDYQGMTFKSNDRKAIAAKALVNEIENLHDEAREGEKGNIRDLYPLRFTFDDKQVFKDVTRLIFSFIEKQNGFSSSDRSKIRTFVNIFIPLFFHVDDVVPEGFAVLSEDEEDLTADEDDEGQSINTEDSDVDADGSSRSPRDRRSRSPSGTPAAAAAVGTTTRRRNGRNRTDDADPSADLLRDVLTKNNKSTPADDNDSSFDKSPSALRDLSATPAPEDDTEGEEPESAAAAATANNNIRDGSYEDKPIKTEEQSSADERESSAAVAATANAGEGLSSSPQPMDVDDQPSNAGDATTGGSQAVEDDDRSTKSNNNNNNYSNHPEGNRLFAAAAAATAPGLHKRTVYSFFCNTPFYSFFRLYQMTYERMRKMKALDAQMKADLDKGKKVNKVATELGLYTSRFEDINLSNGYYTALLDLIDRFFDGEMDQTAFEEKSRYIFVTDAHVLFTIDKLVQSIIKQIQSLTLDEKCVELVELFRSDQNLDSTCPRILSVYRLRAEETVGSDENLYKVNFNTETHKMSIQLLDKDDDMLEPSSQDYYENYVASYMDWANCTDGIDTSKMHPTFLKRNWKPHDRHLSKIFVRSRLQYKISQENYHMYYIIGSEDAFIRPPISSSATSSADDKNDDDAAAAGDDQVAAKSKIEQERTKKWHHWLESRSTGWSRDIESDEAYNSMEAAALKRLTQ
ncbi:hypothetical protein BDB00DRAFT_867052 [Zychaea mexicana]|uniref:uncharacterized protein n=1 Tax=Zychaea mexicana TaxID=64656 RepID=UPI0022FED3E6|nr:uncharacterized protein BDB00DRAFT_867052 [Zychaea mexicana]KAI9498981.1 hypothetical protein BDB00DRAFT_867052 [Zychaea mexicana]